MASASSSSPTTRTKTEAPTFALVLCALFAPGAWAGVSTDEINERLETCIGALNGLDLRVFSGCLANDVTLFNPDIPDAKDLHRLDGRAAVEAHFRAMFESLRRTLKGPPYLQVKPRNVHLQFGASTAVATFEFDRGPGQFGRRTLVFEHLADGWKIVHIHASNVAERP